MFTGFSIDNFKAFGPTQRIPLKPITLIFGPNSAGKSSIIHSLLFAHEASRTGKLDILKTQLGGESVDLGGFRQFTHQSRRENRIALRFEIPALTSRAAQTWGLEAVTVTATFGIRAGEEKTGLDLVLNAFGPLLDVAKENDTFEQAVQYRRMIDELTARSAM